MQDSYQTITSKAWIEDKVKGSRFIAEAIPVTEEREAIAEIEAIRKREYSATHHCSAYRIGPEGQLFRYQDAGEPSGTAGLPILRQIDSRQLTNILVVVTRYFGGTKLGTGGLIRAYGDAASRVLDQIEIVKHIIRIPLLLRFGYNDTSAAIHTINKFDSVILQTQYTDETEMLVGIRRSQVHEFQSAFINALSGRGMAQEQE